MSVPVSPTATDAASALREAHRLLAGQPHWRAEVLAFMALAEAYPAAPRSELVTLIGRDQNWDYSFATSMAEKAGWYDEDLLNTIVGELVAPLYGEA